MMKILDDPKIIVVLCLFLGFAPFLPEPHIWGKLRWVAGGALDMQWLDWVDLVWHAFPFVLLLRLGILRWKR